MRIAILGNAGSWYVSQLQQAAERRGHAATRVDYERLMSTITTGRVQFSEARDDETRLIEERTPHQRDEEFEFDAVIVRTMPPGSLEQVVFRMDALLMLEAAGVQIVNPPRAIECAVDKYLTSARLARAGLPTPRTIVCQTFSGALAAFEELGGDVVVKPVFGAEGRGIVRVDSPDLAVRVFRALERIDAVLYLQEFLRHPGYDVRILWLDGRPLGSMRRCSDDFRTNVSRKARAVPHELREHEVRLAAAAVETVGTRFAGVDLLQDDQGRLYVIEVNAVPGWQAFQRVTGLDVADAVIRSLEAHPGE